MVDVHDGVARIAVIARRNRAGRIEWRLPKCHRENDETLPETAEREVAEETGIQGRVLAELGTIDYWFATNDHRVHKFVHHYLLEATGGRLTIENYLRDARGRRRGLAAVARGPRAPHLPQRASHRQAGLAPSAGDG